MGLINLARLLAILRREGIDLRDVFVYWDGIDTGFRRTLPRYSEPVMEPDDEYQDYDEEET